MMKKKCIFYIGFTVFLLSSYSCEKYLNEKPLQSLVVPRTLDDLEALLNNNNIVNSSSSLNEIVADDYYLETADWQLLMSQSGSVPAYYGEGMSYIWDGSVTNNSWSDAYQMPIYYANVVLDALSSVEPSDPIRFSNVKGTALFYRAFTFERLAQVYARPYSPSAGDDLGLVLRTTSDINVSPARSSVEETYQFIIDDLKAAASLLPETSQYPTHPTRPAAYAALARTLLSVRMYEQAALYADSCLMLRSDLMDYNEINPEGMPVFPEYNEEVIFHSRILPPGILAASRAKIVPELIDSYDTDDLRKTLFFIENTGQSEGTYRFRGSYLGRFNAAGNIVFDGLTTAEMYLIRAECRTRSGNVDGAAADLNQLLTKRWKQGSAWANFKSYSEEELLNAVLSERRKELVFRGQRWSDIRRLNEEGANITLTRLLDGITYQLPPGDLRWTMLLPQEVINLSGIEQNPR